jgi:predicted acetyltransferase
MEIKELNYEQTIELENNIKLGKEADKIYQDFLDNVVLHPSKYTKDGKFIFWRDEHNATYFQLKDDGFVFICAFLHEDYQINVNPSAIFVALKNKRRVVDHLKSAVRKQ